MDGLIESLTQPVLFAPVRPISTDDFEKMIWAEDYRTYKKELDLLASGLQTINAVIWGQRSKMLCSKIEEDGSYEVMRRTHNCGWLLQQAKAIMTGFKGKVQKVTLYHAALYAVMARKQGAQELCMKYRDAVLEKIQILEHFGGECMPFPSLATHVGNRAYARHRWQGEILLAGADPVRFGPLRAELHNAFSRGVDGYPKSLQGCFSMFNDYHDPHAEVTTKAARAVSAEKPDKPEPAPAASPSAMTFAHFEHSGHCDHT